MHEHSSHHHGHVVELPRETEGLPEARNTDLVELQDGDEYELETIPVKKRIGEATVRMLAYNGSVPGPTLKVAQGSTLTVHVTNHGDIEATVHWHGLRLENRYDGTHDTQAPIPVGETFTYQVHVPDPGAYWYHPHIREDSGRYEREELLEEVLLAPSERVVVDLLFEQPGEVALEHTTPERTYRLAKVTVADEPAEPSLEESFQQLRTNAEMAALR